MFRILLILIFIRPFISSLTEPPYVNFIYFFLLLGFLMAWAIVKGLSLGQIRTVKYPLILFVLALLVSLIFSYDKTNSIKELYKYITVLLLFLVAISLSFKERALLIRVIVLTGVLISLLAIYQYFFGFKHISAYIAKYNITDPFIIDYATRKRVFFPFVTPNVLAGYLAMIVPLTFTHKKRFWYIIPLSLALLLTRSLGGLLSLFLGLVIYIYLQGKLEKREVLFLFGFLIIIALVLIARSVTQKQHIQPIFSTMMRLNYWKDTLEIIKVAPLSGVGLGNFNLPQSRYAHNSYLQIWAEMGILGIISILWLIITVFKSAFMNIRNAAQKNQITHLISAHTVFLVHNLIDFTFFLPEVSMIWWVILGLIVSKDNNELNNRSPDL